MGPFMIALLFALGASAWLYVKLQQRTGYGNNRPAAIGASAVGVLLFVVVFMTAKLLGM